MRLTGVLRTAPLHLYYTTRVADAHGLGRCENYWISASFGDGLMAQSYILRLRKDVTGAIEQPLLPAGVALRTLGPNPDMALVKGMHAVLEAGYWEGGGGVPVFRQWWKALRKDYEFDPSLVLLAVDAEGWLAWRSAGSLHFVKDLAVHPRARRRGVGRALMLAVFHEFAGRGATHVDLRTREENSNAQAFYRSLGMTLVSRDPG